MKFKRHFKHEDFPRVVILETEEQLLALWGDVWFTREDTGWWQTEGISVAMPTEMLLDYLSDMAKMQWEDQRFKNGM